MESQAANVYNYRVVLALFLLHPLVNLYFSYLNSLFILLITLNILFTTST
jgi:hypothetical protein